MDRVRTRETAGRADRRSRSRRRGRIVTGELTRTSCKLEWTAERGVEELADAYEAVGLTLEDFQGYRYIRLEQVKRLPAQGALDGDLRWVSGATT